MLSAALTAAALCQSCVGDVALPEKEPGDWIDISVPPAVRLNANAIVSDRHGTIFLGGDRNAPLWRSADRGLTWTEKALGLRPLCDVSALAVKEGETVFAALRGGGVFRSRDHGESWVQVNNHLTDLDIISLTVAGSVVIAGSSGGRIFRSSDSGGSWIEAEGNDRVGPVTSLVADSAGIAYAACWGASVFFSADSGRTWAPVWKGPEEPYIQHLALHNGGHILASVYGNRIYRSAGPGEPWVRIDHGAIPAGIDAIATDRTGRIFAGTWAHGVFCSRDGGDSWEHGEIGLQGLAVGSILCQGGVLLAGTQSYGVFRSTDGGGSWSPPRNYYPTSPDLYRTYWSAGSLSIDSCGAYYLLNQSAIVRSGDGGETWIRACNRVPGKINCLAIHPSSSLFAGSSRGIYVSTDSGESWSIADTSSSGSAEVFGLDVAGSGAIFARTDEGVLRSPDGGASWKNVFNEAPVTALSAGSGGCVYIGTDFRGVLGSADGGDTWRRMTDSLRIFSIAADRRGTVLAASESGILCSSDNGETWKTIRLGGSYNLYSVLAAPHGELAMIYDDFGSLYLSEDRFASWRKVAVPYLHSSIFLSPDGHLFMSERLNPGGLHRSRQTLFPRLPDIGPISSKAPRVSIPSRRMPGSPPA